MTPLANASFSFLFHFSFSYFHFFHFSIFSIFHFFIFSYFHFFYFLFFSLFFFFFFFFFLIFPFFFFFFFFLVFFFFFVFFISPSPPRPPQNIAFSNKKLIFKARFWVREERKKKEERRKKKGRKEERADRNRSPSTIARTGTLCYSRAWKPLTPTLPGGIQAQGMGGRCRLGSPCCVDRTTTCEPRASGGDQCGEQRGPDLQHSTTTLGASLCAMCRSQRWPF